MVAEDFPSTTDSIPCGVLFQRRQATGLSMANPPVAKVAPVQIQERITVANRRMQLLKSEGSYFFDTPLEDCDGAWVTVAGRRLLMLASYNYLGFISDASVLSSAKHAIDRYGIGQHGSRLVSGTTSEHKALERELAEFTGAEDAIVFNSGYVTNLATIAALVGPGDRVIGDEWNHACIVDGCKLSSAEFLTFRHNDLRHLERLLQAGSRGNTLVAIDAVYSMEGDIAPLREIVEICRRHGALLMVDEAHSLGTIGATGHGVLEHFGLPADAIDIKMGTLSKSLGAFGGFIASTETIVEYLRLNARGYIFSGALPPVMISAAREAVQRLSLGSSLPQRLQSTTQLYREQLRHAGFTIYGDGTQIVPLACESEEQAFAFTKRCRELGLYVIPIVYPAVPRDAPRVRTNLTTLHTHDDIRLAVKLLVQAGRETGVLGNQRAPTP